MRLDRHERMNKRQLGCHDQRLVTTLQSIFLVEENLSIQVAEFDPIVIDEVDRSHACADDEACEHAAQGATAYHEDAAFGQRGLAFRSDARHAHLPKKSFFVGHRSSLRCPRVVAKGVRGRKDKNLTTFTYYVSVFVP